MAFLKLRDQVGEERRGGIARRGRKEGRAAGQRCGPPGLLPGWVGAREAGCRPGDWRAETGPGTAADPPVS